MSEETMASDEMRDLLEDEEEDRDDPREDEDEETAELIRTFGRCKWFDVSRGFGFVAPDPNNEEDDTTTNTTYNCDDVFVYQSTIQMAGFRCLVEGERVSLWYRHSRRGLEATRVCGPDGQDCQGRDGGGQRRRRRRRRRPDRCYNCNESGHHASQCVHERIPKRCYKCTSTEHLAASCPVRQPPIPSTIDDDPPQIPRTEAATSG